MPNQFTFDSPSSNTKEEHLLARPRAAGLLVSAALLATLVLAAVAAGAIQKPAALGTVTLRLGQDWDSLDPYTVAGRGTPWATQAPGYDRLVSFGPKGP